jgi:multiple sugar transport system permease protein
MKFNSKLTEDNIMEQVSEHKNIIIYLILLSVGLLFLLPYTWVVLTSFMTNTEAAGGALIPRNPTLFHYSKLLMETLFFNWLINTLIVAGSTTVLVVIIDSLIAFSLTRIDWPGRKVLVAVILASFMVPYFTNFVPLYTIISELGLVNNYLGVILPFAANPIGVFLLYQFFKDIPEEVQEAARMDGFSTFQIYYKIVLPMSTPILTALALFVFIWSWNQFLWPLLVLHEAELYTLPVGLESLQNLAPFQPGFVMAGTVLTSVPLFILFLFLREKLVQSIQIQATGK